MSISKTTNQVKDQTNNEQTYQFNPDGWPLNPTTGQPFSRNEIITDPAIPYPLDIDTTSQYWRRRTPSELAAEQQRIAKKQKARANRQTNKKTFQASQVLSSVTLQQTDQADAMAEQLDRVNGQKEESHTVAWFVNGYFYKTLEVT